MIIYLSNDSASRFYVERLCDRYSDANLHTFGHEEGALKFLQESDISENITLVTESDIYPLETTYPYGPKLPLTLLKKASQIGAKCLILADNLAEDFPCILHDNEIDADILPFDSRYNVLEQLFIKEARNPEIKLS